MCTVLHCNGNIILEKPLDFMHCVASRFGYPNYRWSQLVRIINDLLHYENVIIYIGVMDLRKNYKYAFSC